MGNKINKNKSNKRSTPSKLTVQAREARVQYGKGAGSREPVERTPMPSVNDLRCNRIKDAPTIQLAPVLALLREAENPGGSS
jgi:hypothetical protein